MRCRVYLDVYTEITSGLGLTCALVKLKYISSELAAKSTLNVKFKTES